MISKENDEKLDNMVLQKCEEEIKIEVLEKIKANMINKNTEMNESIEKIDEKTLDDISEFEEKIDIKRSERNFIDDDICLLSDKVDSYLYF